MRYNDIKLFLEGEKYEDLIFSYRETFNEVEKIKDNLCLGYYFHADTIREALNYCSGYYGDLILPTVLLDAHIETLSGKAIIASESEKITVARNTATVTTDLIRKTRNVFGAYVDMSEKFIGTFQSMLKAIEKEYQAIKKVG
jgi:hypothetical protein